MLSCSVDVDAVFEHSETETSMRGRTQPVCSVLNARITTLGERADDIFFVIDENGETIAEKEIGKQLINTLCQSLNQVDEDN